MTEAGQKWAYEFVNDQAEFWIKAFSEEVERRANEYCKHPVVLERPCSYCREVAYKNLKRELLGE